MDRSSGANSDDPLLHIISVGIASACRNAHNLSNATAPLLFFFILSYKRENVVVTESGWPEETVPRRVRRSVRRF